MAEAPRYPHHCPHCVFLGRQGVDDLYFCRQNPERPSLRFRHGVQVWHESRVAVDAAHAWVAEGLFVGCTRIALLLACRRGLISKTDADAALAGVPLEDDK